MSLNDPIGAALSKVMNAEKIGQKECSVKFPSKLMKCVFTVMNDGQYIGSYDEIEDTRGNLLKINLLGRINNCGVIKPRYPVKMDGYEKFEKRYLPAKGFGIIFVSTSQGLMSHYEAQKKKLGGKLIAFVY
jgi:small subunit ribosomal protein S8